MLFVDRRLEFNATTKCFCLDRSGPERKLPNAEMLEMNRLYRTIGRCEQQLARLQIHEPASTHICENTDLASLVQPPGCSTSVLAARSCFWMSSSSITATRGKANRRPMHFRWVNRLAALPSKYPNVATRRAFPVKPNSGQPRQGWQERGVQLRFGDADSQKAPVRVGERPAI